MRASFGAVSSGQSGAPDAARGILSKMCAKALHAAKKTTVCKNADGYLHLI